jgi:hypothetical protein
MLLQELRHEHVIELREVYTHNGALSLVFEFCVTDLEKARAKRLCAILLWPCSHACPVHTLTAHTARMRPDVTLPLIFPRLISSPADHPGQNRPSGRFPHQGLPAGRPARPRVLPGQLGPAPRPEARQPTAHGGRAGETGRLWTGAVLRLTRKEVYGTSRYEMVRTAPEKNSPAPNAKWKAFSHALGSSGGALRQHRPLTLAELLAWAESTVVTRW